MGLNNFTTKGGGSAEFTDVESEDINNSDTISTTDLDVSGSAGSLSTDEITNSGTMQTTDLDVTGTATGVGPITKTRVFMSTRSTASKLPLDKVSYDRDNNFTTTNNEYIVPSDGTYDVEFNILGINVTSRVTIDLKRNNQKLVTAETTESESNFPTLSGSDTRELSQGDSIFLENRNGADVGSGSSNSFLVVKRIE
jgi:hypothetical protein